MSGQPLLFSHFSIQNQFFTMKKVLVLTLVCLLGGASVSMAQKQGSMASAPEKFIIIKGKVGMSADEGVMLNTTKLSDQDAASLKALLMADPSAGYIEMVESDGSVKSYGSLKLSSAKFRGNTVSALPLQGGENMTKNCNNIIITRCGSQALKGSTALKASQLLKAYQQ
jgi:hypothetical protein